MKLQFRTFSALLSVSIAAGVIAEVKPPTFRPVDIDTKVKIGYGLAIADVDGDRKDDILLVDKDIVAWYRNPGWEKFVMVEKLTDRDHVCIDAGDIDGDGKAEVAVGAQWNPGDTVNSGSVHYLIAPEDRTQLWTPVKLPNEPTVHRMRWMQGKSGQSELVVVPLHGRGNKGGKGAGVRVLAYQVPPDPAQDAWKTSLIDDNMHLTHNFDPVNWLESTGDEILLAGKEGVFLVTPQPSGWQRRHLSSNGAGEVRHGILPSRSKFFAAIEPMHGNQIVVYSPRDANDLASFWRRTVVDDTLLAGHAVATGDLLRTGSDQLVVGWRGLRGTDRVGIKLYIPLDSSGSQWQTVLVDDNQMACEDLKLADLNGDQRLDIIAAGRRTKNLKVYFNEGAQ